MSLSKDEKLPLDPTEHSQNCPLCGNPATYKLFDHGRQKLFNCPICISFALYTDAEESLSEISKTARDNYSKQARECAEDKILVIDVKRQLGDIINTSRGPVEIYWATVYPQYRLRGN